MDWIRHSYYTMYVFQYFLIVAYTCIYEYADCINIGSGSWSAGELMMIITQKHGCWHTYGLLWIVCLMMFNWMQFGKLLHTHTHIYIYICTQVAI